MELKGIVSQILAEQSGSSPSGGWRKQEFVLEIPGTYPKKVCIAIWGNNIDSFGLKEGEEVTASIDVESREYNGKWYTNVKAWRVSREETSQTPSEDGYWPDVADAETTTKSGSSEESFDDLPF